MVKDTLRDRLRRYGPNGDNSIIAFHDNSSTIAGNTVRTLERTCVDKPSTMREACVCLHPTLTAETHNFPTGVAPFPGAETGTGGRIRDMQASH